MIRHFRNFRNAFTLIELLVFAAIFSVCIIAFITILISVLRVQSHQAGEVEVNEQSQFLLQRVQYYVERSSLVDIPQDTATGTLKLYLGINNQDPTVITVSSGTVYVQQTATGTPQALTSSKVIVSNLQFVRRANPPGHDTVNVSFSISYNTGNIQQMFTQFFQFSVARVSAATFDSNLIPSSTSGAYGIGTASSYWNSINGTVYFNGTNVGIGVSSPGQTLEVNGGLRLNTSNSRPACDSSQRGTFWVVESGSGTKDSVQVCVKNASDTYLWAGIY
jgi:competence protein ComGC